MLLAQVDTLEYQRSFFVILSLTVCDLASDMLAACFMENFLLI